MTDSFFHEGDLVGVLTTQPLDRLLDYKAPEGGCHLGAFVEVPLGPRKVLGVVWGAGRGDYDRAKIRSVIRVLDVAPMRDEMRSFLTRAAEYTLTPMPAMLRLGTRAPGLGDAQSMRKVYRPGDVTPDRMTGAREKVLAVLRDYGGLSFTLGEVAEMAGVGTSVVKGLVKLGAVSEEEAPRDTPYPQLDPDYGSKDLSADQAAGAEALRAALRSEGYGTTLLKGVTGSGKTEVYLEAVAECLRMGRH
ncbi:MAG: primosomal protein N', partial [Pseudomonadota bacterium]